MGRLRVAVHSSIVLNGLRMTLTNQKITERALSIKGDAKYVGLRIDLGYDIPVSAQVKISPYAEFVYGSGVNFNLAGPTTGYNASVNMVHLGVGMSWREQTERKNSSSSLNISARKRPLSFEFPVRLRSKHSLCNSCKMNSIAETIMV